MEAELEASGFWGNEAEVGEAMSPVIDKGLAPLNEDETNDVPAVAITVTLPNM